MHLQLIDWIIVALSLLICFVPALFFGKRAGKSTSEFFVSGRAVPWWLAGLSMVATTFSSDTPNLVTDIVRRNGVAGNWVWWVATRKCGRPTPVSAASSSNRGRGRSRC